MDSMLKEQKLRPVKNEMMGHNLQLCRECELVSSSKKKQSRKAFVQQWISNGKIWWWFTIGEYNTTLPSSYSYVHSHTNKKFKLSHCKIFESKVNKDLTLHLIGPKFETTAYHWGLFCYIYPSLNDIWVYQEQKKTYSLEPHFPILKHWQQYCLKLDLHFQINKSRKFVILNHQF